MLITSDTTRCFYGCGLLHSGRLNTRSAKSVQFANLQWLLNIPQFHHVNQNQQLSFKECFTHTLHLNKVPHEMQYPIYTMLSSPQNLVHVRIQAVMMGADRPDGWRQLAGVKAELDVFRWVPTGEHPEGNWGLYIQDEVQTKDKQKEPSRTIT